MITLITIDNITERANELIFEDYPSMEKHWFKRAQVKYIVKAIILLDKEEKAPERKRTKTAKGVGTSD